MRLSTGFLIVAVSLVGASTAHAESRPFAQGFVNGYGLATDAGGNVYVAAAGGVAKFTPDGTRTRTFPSSFGFNWIVDVAVDPTGNLYVSDWSGSSAQTIRKLAPDGTNLWTGGAFASTASVAVLGDRVYVGADDRVKILDAATGAVINESPSLTVVGDRFGIVDVATGNGQVYALKNGRVHVLDADGTPRSAVQRGEDAWEGRIDVGDDDRIRLAWKYVRVDVLDDALTVLGQDDVPTAVRGVAEFGDRVYLLNGHNSVISMEKRFELVPGGGLPATDPPPPPPVPTPTPTVGPPPSWPPDEPPPARLPSVTINAGALFTNDPHVRLSITEPAGTTAFHLANDGGFAPLRSFTPRSFASWTLAESGAERLPKTVYARFAPSGQILQDDIILDQTAPILSRATATRSGKRYTLRLKAADSTSGLAGLQVVGKTSRVYLRYSSRVRAVLPAGRVRVRVVDHAGNWSSTKRIK
jgi:hypothetical protein